MRRQAYEDLKKWADSPRRKPLILRGARQVGKTWLVTHFGRENFNHLAHLVFLENESLKNLFTGSLEPDMLLRAIGAYAGVDVFGGKTLIFFDEVQECPRAIESLKLFSELYPEIPIIAAGSLLGVALNREGAQEGRISWPVGKVSYLDLYPMNFREFLWAMGEDGLADFIQLNTLSALEVFHEKYESLFRSYLFLGGMPAVVQAYLDSNLYSEARQIQLNLLRDYEHDFSKHVSSPMEVEHIREVFASIPTQIARETQSNKFIYSQVKPGGRGREYKDAIRWLVDAGLVIKVNKVSRPGIPLKTYEDAQCFKLYLLDVGLLGAELELDEKSILLGSNLFTHDKGVYAEQFVCEQLISAGCSLYYWSADGKKQKGELDFIYSYEGDVYPIEVKADENIKSKSIAVFSQQYSIPKSIRLSLRGFQDNGWLVNIPLYAANILPVSLGDERK